MRDDAIRCKKMFHLYEFRENLQFVSDDNLSYRFLGQQDAVSYKTGRPKEARKNGLSEVSDADVYNAPKTQRMWLEMLRTRVRKCMR